MTRATSRIVQYMMTITATKIVSAQKRVQTIAASNRWLPAATPRESSVLQWSGWPPLR
jgi:hypothetical protein